MSSPWIDEAEVDAGTAQEWEARPPPRSGPPGRVRRSGHPALARAWARLRAASGPARRAEGPTGAELEELGPAAGAAATDEAFDLELPGLQVQTSLPLPTFGPWPAGPVLVRVGGRIQLRGAISTGDPSSKVTFTAGEQKADFEAKVSQAFGGISLTGSVEPGRVSKLGLKVGTELVEIELAARVDLTKPFVLSLKPKRTLEGRFTFGGWRFQGKIVPALEVSFTPNPAWTGWASLGRGLVSVARGVTAVGRGLFFAGELATATAVGAAAIGATLAVAGIAWVGFVLYQIGQAHRDGRALALGRTFADGYASALARMTSDIALYRDTPAGQRSYWHDLTYDWRYAYDWWRPRWVDGEDRAALGHFHGLGRIAAVQDVALFLQVHGAQAWKDLAADHRRRYAQAEGFRAQRYKQLLHARLRAGQPIGLASFGGGPGAPPPGQRALDEPAGEW